MHSLRSSLHKSQQLSETLSQGQYGEGNTADCMYSTKAPGFVRRFQFNLGMESLRYMAACLLYQVLMRYILQHFAIRQPRPALDYDNNILTEGTSLMDAVCCI